MSENFIVAIDGPAGAGKSTVAKILAQQLSYVYIDTGAMYRSVALKCLKENKTTDEDIQAVVKNINIAFEPTESGNKVLLDDIDVTNEIRSTQVTTLSSQVAKNEVVRDVLSKMQQQMGESGGVVMDGRDIGTCVFPNAKYKFFLTASVEERAKRRFIEMQEKGFDVCLEQLLCEIEQRDYEDSTRKIAPLKQAEDAILIDSSNLTIMETAELLFAICSGKQHAV